jgi:beta-N-acetylhexosaminidase
VRGPVKVTAASGRQKARKSLEEALRRAGAQLGDGGSTVHLIGYGDGPADLSRGASATVAMDTPYLLGRADSPVLLATYSSSAASMEALARVLTGRARAVGKSPVGVTDLPRTVC